MSFPALSRVALVQFQVRTGEWDANRQRALELIESIEPGTLVVLPELWGCGFAGADLARLAGRTPALLEELTGLAAGRDLVIAGSLPEPRPEGRPVNTLFVVDGQGVRGRYRKQHLFRAWDEDRWFQPGTDPRPVPAAGGLLGPLVCFDLRFPDLARRHCLRGASLLVVSAQWPLARIDQWRILARARAVENQCFLVAANSRGREGEIQFGGHSLVVGPDGGVVAEAGEGEEVVIADLDWSAAALARSRFRTVGDNPWPGRDADQILALDRLLALLAPAREQGARVAFTNGCFDLLHPGHVSYLEQARRWADLLVVGLNSDCSVRAIKGPARPVNPERDRARVLAGLGCVDFVVLFDQKTPLELIRAINPDVLVKGADWPEEKIVGAAEVRAAGGRVERIRFEHSCSTTAIIEKIRQQEKLS